MSSYTTPEYVQAELQASTAFSSSTTPSLTDINRWIEEDSKLIEIKSGQIFASTAVSSTYFDYDGSGIFRLPHVPIISIEMFKYNSYGEGVTPNWLSLEEGFDKNYLLYSDEGELEFVSGQNATNKVIPCSGKKKLVMSYTYGYSTTPLEIQKLATLLVAKRAIMTLISSQANSEGGNIQVGTISVTDPSNFGVNYIKQMNADIDSLFSQVGQGLNTFRGTRVYD